MDELKGYDEWLEAPYTDVDEDEDETELDLCNFCGREAVHCICP